MVKENMAEFEVTEEDTEDRNKVGDANPLWRPLMGKAERRRNVFVLSVGCVILTKAKQCLIFRMWCILPR